MIPDFILEGDSVDIDSEVEKFGQLVLEYREKIGDELITEASTWSLKEWIEILEECLSSGKTYWEVTGETYRGHDKSVDYWKYIKSFMKYKMFFNLSGKIYIITKEEYV